ncbi:MAG: FGGY family carbohydrate kinase [bacterium]|nr:FGGY family carbohydrate kinase [bacterium]
MTLLGVDVGTTGCKAAAVGLDGSVRATAYREYPLATPRPGWAELDPDGVWETVCATIREVAAAVAEPPRALAFATLGEAVTPIDASGEALAPTIVSFDGRAGACFEELVAAVGTERLTAVCGVAPQPHYSVAKWRWIATETPETYRRAATLACFGDLCAVRLGLPPVIDHTMATRTLAFDAAGACWSAEILDAAGVDVRKLPAPVPTGTVVGAVAARQARDLGLADGALLVAGGLDQVCAARGAGIAAGADACAMLSLGTVAVLAAVLRTDRPAPSSVPTVPYLEAGTRLAIAGTPAGGAVLRWYRDRFGAVDVAVPEGAGTEDGFYDRIVAGVADVETDLIVLPHFAGSRTAFDDPQATAALIGLTFATERHHIVRALLEGVALETAVMAQRFAAAGAPVTSLRAVGGGSRSAVWMQIVADVLGIPVDSTASADAAAVGAALIAGAATGLSAGDGWGLPPSRRYEPEESAGRRHRAKLARYHDLYRALTAVRGPGR